ncbi:MAG TPA: hypothetical protein VHF27_08905 [Acidimicrobiales bacterium]|nr:hypothetical protein [Acidimicrobiales bacterium]
MRGPRFLRIPRPSPRQLTAAVAVLGVLAGLAVVVLPVRAAFGDDPLLRLQPFSPALDHAVTEVDCGAAVGNLGRRSEGVSLYGLARDGACREAASRQVATAVATVTVIGVLGFLILSGNRRRELSA